MIEYAFQTHFKYDVSIHSPFLFVLGVLEHVICQAPGGGADLCLCGAAELLAGLWSCLERGLLLHRLDSPKGNAMEMCCALGDVYKSL